MHDLENITNAQNGLPTWTFVLEWNRELINGTWKLSSRFWLEDRLFKMRYIQRIINYSRRVEKTLP